MLAPPVKHFVTIVLLFPSFSLGVMVLSGSKELILFAIKMNVFDVLGHYPYCIHERKLTTHIVSQIFFHFKK